MTHYATGEGVRIYIAVGGCRSHAERLLTDRIDAHLHRAIESSPICVSGSSEAAKMISLIPRAVQDILAEIPVGTGEYYAELSYNRS